MEKYRILIVDDEPMLANMLQDGITSLGHECDTAANGTTALELLRARTFDLMVTDVIMPGMDGFVLTHAAKGLHPELAVIVMTGYSQNEAYERALASGASDFINKPFTIVELMARIDRVIRDARAIGQMKKKHDDAANISRDMISGLQEEAAEQINKLKQTISELKQTDG